MRARVIDDGLRKKLRRPFGKVMQTKQVISSLKKAHGKIVCVGDICSLALIREGIIPAISICDGRSLRRSVRKSLTREILQNYNKVYHVRNAAGMISEAARIALESALAGKDTCCISVDGEEDLLALVAIMKCRKGDIVIYGQPGEGLVYIRVGPTVKAKARAIFRKMKIIRK
ncbi:MAG: DUF359 domain-containing protein [Candidatus Micrarchaeia archaeon]